MSSIVKKILMSLTGLVMVGFVFIHMLGNLQMFQGPDAINEYAHFLKTLPMPLLWGFRLVLIISVGVHVWMAILLTKDNRTARPDHYLKISRVQATLSSRTMGISGSFILFFIVFHILHFTTRVIFPEYQDEAYYTVLNQRAVFNVYQMVVSSFQIFWVVAFYVIAMLFLSLHLRHAVWSMFQTLGWANAKVRPWLKHFALTYALIIFVGFVSIPIAAYSGYLPSIDFNPFILLGSEQLPFDSAQL